MTTISYFFTILSTTFLIWILSAKKTAIHFSNDTLWQKYFSKKQTALPNLRQFCMTHTKLQNGSHIIVQYSYSVFSIYFSDQHIGWKDIFFLLGKCERDTSGRYETPHWNLSFLRFLELGYYLREWKGFPVLLSPWEQFCGIEVTFLWDCMMWNTILQKSNL